LSEAKASKYSTKDQLPLLLQKCRNLEIAIRNNRYVKDYAGIDVVDGEFDHMQVSVQQLAVVLVHICGVTESVPPAFKDYRSAIGRTISILCDSDSQ
jgi:hypothetical protein